MSDTAFQDFYPDDLAHCYGCGRLNEHGLHVRRFWDGEQTVCRLRPRPYHTAVPGYVYGGFIASLMILPVFGSKGSRPPFVATVCSIRSLNSVFGTDM